jgi:uncharacterized membrane protein AbrB (regulator of aidB expression)
MIKIKEIEIGLPKWWKIAFVIILIIIALRLEPSKLVEWIEQLVQKYLSG